MHGNKSKINLYKNTYLSASFKELSNEDFYTILFGDRNREYPCIFEQEDRTINKSPYKVIKNFELLISMAPKRPDMYIFPVTFFNHKYKLKTLNQLFAFVIDIDQVSYASIPGLVKALESSHLKPTLLVNSGNGLHFYYVLDVPLDCYDHRKHLINKILKTLREYWGSFQYKVDKGLSVIQPYRAVGSLSKNGQITKSYLVGEKYQIKTLKEKLNIPLNSNVSFWQKSSESVKDFVLNNIKKQKSNWRPNGSMYFYRHCLKRVLNEVVEGYRYKALFALAIVGYKCCISQLEVEKDILACWQEFNKKCSPGQRIRENEIPKALQGFNNRFTLVSSLQLETLFGFKFPRKRKNGRTQKEHLKSMHERRQILKKQKVKKISQLIQQSYSKKEIAAIMGMSLQNLYATYKNLFKKKH